MYDFKVCPHGAIATAIYLSQLMDYMEPTDACENITFRQLRLRAIITVEIARCEQPFKAYWRIQRGRQECASPPQEVQIL